MKKNLVLLGIVVALAAPSFSLLAGETVQSKKAVRKEAQSTQAAVVSRMPVNLHPNRETFYITNQVVTGSHIPVVVTRYQGHNITSSPSVTYDQTDIGATGALDVGGALVTRDPAISYGRGR